MTETTGTNKKYRIFISPANHYKPYIIGGGYTEKQQMDKLAPLFAAALSEYEGAEPVLTTVYCEDRSYTGRPEEARDLKCDLYVALHTNAGGGRGACVFYHPALALSKEVALSVVKELNSVCPIKSNRAVQPAIYAWDTVNWNFGELRIPARYGIPPILIEHEFHDTVDGANWIVSNLKAIAAADAAAIARALGLKRKPIPGDVNGDGKVDSVDAVQILRFDAAVSDLTPEQLQKADVNGDGKVDSVDAAAVLRIDSGLADAEDE